MSAKPSPKTKSAPAAARPRSSASPTTTDQTILEQIQLSRITDRLKDLDATSSLLRAFGEDPQRYAQQLAKQYEALSTKHPLPAVFQKSTLPIRVGTALNTIADLFGQWQTIVAPNATVSLVQTPTSPDTGGSIGAEIYTGDLALGGEIYNSDTLEQWWVNTWQYIIPLPPTPANNPFLGHISYRFNVGADVGFYRQDFLTGSVNVYATVATTNDLANHPIDFSQPASSTFAITETLPVSAVPPIISGNAQITGSITPIGGGTPAIGIIVGLIFSVAKGNLQIIPGEYSLIELTNPDAQTSADIGKIEYRYDEIFWVEAVTKWLARQP
jgi:hypothetical protein